MPPERLLLLGSVRAGVGHQASALWRRWSAEARGGRGRRPGSTGLWCVLEADLEGGELQLGPCTAWPVTGLDAGWQGCVL